MTPMILHWFFDEWIIESVRGTIKNRVLDYMKHLFSFYNSTDFVNNLFHARKVQLVFQF